MQQFFINEKEAGRRLDQYLTRLLPNAGTSFIYKMIRKKNITVNRKKTEGNVHLELGDSIELFFSEDTYTKLSGGKKVYGDRLDNDISVKKETKEYTKAYASLSGIDIVYEDDDFIFINKPLGVLSQKASYNDVSINEWLVGYLINKGDINPSQLATFKPAFCNRLDRNTTGLVLGGKTLRGLKVLSNMLANRTLHKYYLTTVHGKVDDRLLVNKESYLDKYAYLVKNKAKNKVEVFDSKKEAEQKGYNPDVIKEIHTGFRLVEAKSDELILEIELYTGKSHQIRAHLAHLGHPIVGDSKYGYEKKDFQDLHAYRVVFPEIEEFPSISGKEFVC